MNKQKKVKIIFDDISKRYDFLNHLLSAGIDFYWRKKALKLSKIQKDAVLLDIACGTGDFAIAAHKLGIGKIIGADLSLKMLNLFKKKADWIIGKEIQTVAEFLPFKNESFTNITVAFGVRNFYDIQKGFDEFFRILKSGGKATILEFRLPSNKLLKTVFLFYFKKLLPLIGNLISRSNEAYKYLPESVDEFYNNVNLSLLLKNSGFSNIEISSLTFGIVQVVIASKL